MALRRLQVREPFIEFRLQRLEPLLVGFSPWLSERDGQHFEATNYRPERHNSKTRFFAVLVPRYGNLVN